MKVERGENPTVGRHPQMIGAAKEGIQKAFDTHSDRATAIVNGSSDFWS
jgi:hypothetical protein